MKLQKRDGAKVQKDLKSAAAAQAKAAGEAASSHAKAVVDDLWYAIKHERIAQIFLVLLLISLVCWQMPYVQWIFYPFRLFVTTVHEACHALVCRLTGGQVLGMSIAADHSGLTQYRGGIEFLVNLAGYLGSSIVGGLLIWFGRKPDNARGILNTIGIIILSLTVFYGGGGFFSVISMLLIGAALVAVAKKCSDNVCHMLLLVLAVQTTLNALVDIQVVFLISALNANAFSDAHNLQELTNVPSIAWSILFAVVSVVVLFYAFWISYRPKKVAEAKSDKPTREKVPAAATSATASSNEEEPEEPVPALTAQADESQQWGTETADDGQRLDISQKESQPL